MGMILRHRPEYIAAMEKKIEKLEEKLPHFDPETNHFVKADSEPVLDNKQEETRLVQAEAPKPE